MNWGERKIKVVKIKRNKVLIKYELLNDNKKKWWLNF